MTSPACTTYSLPWAQFAGSAATSLSPKLDIIVITAGFSLDKATLKIRMDNASSLGGALAPMGIVQALTSISPAVKKDCKPSRR